MNDIKIRPSTAQDAEAIGAIAKTAWKPIFDGYREQLGDEIFHFLYPEDPIEKKKEECAPEMGVGAMAISAIVVPLVSLLTKGKTAPETEELFETMKK